MRELVPGVAYEALAAKLVDLTAERDRARDTAVALEQQLARVGALAEMCERKAKSDRKKASSAALNLGQIDGLQRRAANYEIVAQGLRAALNPEDQP